MKTNSLAPGSPVTLKDGTRTIYQGPQDNPAFGFFGNPGQFFGRPMSDIQPAAGQAVHTPTPYRIVEIDNALRGKIQFIVADNQHGKQRVFIADAGFDYDSAPTRDICKANAAFIVRACNAHAGLVAALEQAQAALRTIASRIENQNPELGVYAHEQATLAYEPLRTLSEARAALQSAKE